MKISKYNALTDYLRHNQASVCRLTFLDIEDLIGSPLPRSSISHASVFWSNTNQHYAQCWLRAGYLVSHYDISEQYTVFSKNLSLAAKLLARSEKTHQTTPHTPSRSFSPLIQFCQPTESCESIINRSRSYLQLIRSDPNARYLSWEHCYGYFFLHHNTPDSEELDFMCLHLAWYLASWGMLRGGAFLLQKDYRIHLPVVKELTNPKYRTLYACSPEKLCLSSVQNLIMELSQSMVAHYRSLTSDLGDGQGKIASDTLITKILLGTMGCVPAYDRYFKSGLRLCNVAQQHFGPKSIFQLARYYLANQESLEAYRKEISFGRIEYTPMKVLDMCFWQSGYDADQQPTSPEHK